jgi:hypothetical protein
MIRIMGQRVDDNNHRVHNPNNPGVDLRTKGVQTYTKGMGINVITGMALLS